jgi:hypothetical protein
MCQRGSQIEGIGRGEAPANQSKHCRRKKSQQSPERASGGAVENDGRNDEQPTS